jgi:predicted DNA binding protein
MAIEASFTATEGEFPLAAVFEEFPGTQIELDRVVPTDGAIIPYFWVEDANVAAIDMSDVAHPGIQDIRVVDNVNGEAFIRIEWDFDYESVLTAIIETKAELISAIGTHAQWTFDIRGDDQQAISDFHTYCQDHDIPLELTQLHALSPLQSGYEYNLTEAQREALTLAYARGYYDSPRQLPQQALAEELGITRQAVASRLQRGTRRLIASTVITPAE